MPSERARAAGSASQSSPARPDAPAETLVAVACVSAALLMTELALTRIFSVMMYYHFAFLAISIALFGLSASGVFAFVRRRHFAREETGPLLGDPSLVYAACTVVSLFVLVRMRVGLNYSPRNLALMLTIYALAALPFFTGGLVVTLAISRLSSRINAVYAADCSAPPRDASCCSRCSIESARRASCCGGRGLAGAAVLFVPPRAGPRWRGRRGDPRGAARRPAVGRRPVRRHGHQGPRGRPRAVQQVEFVLAHRRLRTRRTATGRSAPPTRARCRTRGSWTSTRPRRRPSCTSRPDLSNAQYLRYELTALAYHLKDGGGGGDPGPDAGGFTALVIGPGRGRDLVSALVFGAGRVDGVEINPIIAHDVMRDRFQDFSGGIYTHPRVRVAVDDGRSFVAGRPNRVRRHPGIARGHLGRHRRRRLHPHREHAVHRRSVQRLPRSLSDDGMLTITRWVFDGLRLVSLAQEACARARLGRRDHAWRSCSTIAWPRSC